MQENGSMPMSLRHWTATQSLTVGLEVLRFIASQGKPVILSPENIAKNALLIADALIAQGGIISAKS